MTGLLLLHGEYALRSARTEETHSLFHSCPDRLSVVSDGRQTGQCSANRSVKPAWQKNSPKRTKRMPQPGSTSGCQISGERCRTERSGGPDPVEKTAHQEPGGPNTIGVPYRNRVREPNKIPPQPETGTIKRRNRTLLLPGTVWQNGLCLATAHPNIRTRRGNGYRKRPNRT